jgi:CheY-like chemotaxis protein
LLNIINNAIKYNRPEGEVFIGIEVKDVPQYPVKVRITVRDTGFGIKPEDLPKLFSPFERLGAEGTGKEGTGLGLVVVKKLTELMDGSIGVESEYGVGSSFWVEFLAAKNPVDQVKTGVKAAISEPVEASRPIRVLYIEDNQANIDLLTMGFEQLCPQNELFTAKNGSLGIIEAKKLIPDLILLDLNMPDMHGSAVLAELRKEESTSKIPVVIISADAMPAQRKNLLDAGAEDFLTKPIDMLELLQTMKKVVKS